jgi:hypothetical protein
VNCSDYTFELNRLLVQEQYDSQSVEEIIDEIITDYATGFTSVNVVCPIEISKITFDRITVGDCLRKLAQLTNYSWYVDSDKDVHFFEKYTNAAPFDIEDDNGSMLKDSLVLNRDISQLRNRVYIKGGEIEGDARSESFNGDGTKKTFVIGNKFASKPTVTVGGAGQNVGIDYLDDEASYDCFWDYMRQYIRFKDATVPAAGTNNIVVSGIPLYRVVAMVQNDESVADYGVYEFKKVDNNIKSLDEARNYGIAQLGAYANEIIEGGFQTDQDGLRSGQVLRINSVLRGLDEYFLIQKVTLKMQSPSSWTYSVGLATMKTIGIIEFLISQLKAKDEIVGDTGSTTLDKSYFVKEGLEITESLAAAVDDTIAENIEITEAVQRNVGVDPVFVFAPYVPVNLSDEKVEAQFDRARFS